MLSVAAGCESAEYSETADVFRALVFEDAAVSTADAGGVDGGGSMDATVAPVPPTDGGANEDGGAAVDVSAEAAIIANVIASGPGCRASTAQVALAGDRSTFDVDFGRYVLTTTADDTQNTTGCTVSIQVDAPAGKTLAIESFVLRGTTNLPDGASARLSTYYSYVGLPTSSTKVIPLPGPSRGSFETKVTFGDGEALYRPCDNTRRLLNLLISMSLDAADSEPDAQASVERLSSLRFVVRRCR